MHTPVELISTICSAFKNVFAIWIPFILVPFYTINDLKCHPCISGCPGKPVAVLLICYRVQVTQKSILHLSGSSSKASIFLINKRSLQNHLIFYYLLSRGLWLDVRTPETMHNPYNYPSSPIVVYQQKNLFLNQNLSTPKQILSNRIQVKHTDLDNNVSVFFCNRPAKIDNCVFW